MQLLLKREPASARHRHDSEKQIVSDRDACEAISPGYSSWMFANPQHNGVGGYARRSSSQGSFDRPRIDEPCIFQRVS